MHFLKKQLRLTLSFVFVLGLTFPLFAKHTRLILSVKRADYKKVCDSVIAAGGEVNREFAILEAVAVSVPEQQAAKIMSMPEVFAVVKDDIIEPPRPRTINKPGFGAIPNVVDARVSEAQSLSVAKLEELMAEPTNYSPFTNNLLRATEFSANTGKFGEGVVVAVIDAGVSSGASAVADRIVGAENFTGDGIPGDSPMNGSHGTWVACCIGAFAVFGFGNPVIANTIETYAPGSTIPDFFGVGVDGIPMVGVAPAVSFYSLKVFPASGGGASRSTIAAAWERAIQLKEDHNRGKGGSNIRVINLSLGGPTLFSGLDELTAPLVTAADRAGILVVASAGNEGPSGITGGSPGTLKNLLTVGATSVAAHERIVADLFFAGPGFGALWRPVNNHVMTIFSSRGPTADGRPDPEVVAPGDWRYVQAANGSSINWVSGTSFSAPTVSGVAALLFSAEPHASPSSVRSAIMLGANRKLVDGKPTFTQDQGFGHVDAFAAYKKLRFHPGPIKDQGPARRTVAENISKGIRARTISQKNWHRTAKLSPGQRSEYFFSIDASVRSFTVDVTSVNPSLPPEEQNQLFTDDVIVAIQTGVTSDQDYVGGTPAFVNSPTSFTVEDNVSFGVGRITLMGDWTNAGDVRVSISVRKDLGPIDYGKKIGDSKIREGQSVNFTVDVPEGATNLSSTLLWIGDWGKWPTNDLDIIITDPDNNLNFDGATLASPEFVSIASPTAGEWNFEVNGFTIFKKIDFFKLFVDVEVGGMLLRGQIAQAGKISTSGKVSLIPTEFGISQNYPNPFNPSTNIAYGLPEDSDVKLQIFNLKGQLVQTLVDAAQPAGYHTAVWNGRDNFGKQVASGTYIYRISAGQKFVASKRLVLLK